MISKKIKTKYKNIMKKIFLKSLLVLIGVLITSLTTNVWASTWMEEPVVVIKGTDYSAGSLKSLSLGTQTDIAVTWVHWYGKRDNKDTDGMWAEGKFTYGISGTTGTASTWNDITVSGSNWYDNYKTVYINTNINLQLCSNRKPGDYELYFYFQHRTGNSSYIYYSNNSSNYHVTWTLPDPTIEFTSNHTPVKGQPVTLSTAVSNWPYGMTIKSVTYKHNGTAISSITTGDLSSTSYTHTPTVSGSGKYTVEVVCTFGTAGDITYTETMDITASNTVTYGSHTNGSFTIAVPNVSASSSSKQAASGQRVDIAATGNTGYEFSAWDVYKTGTPATKVSTNASTATTYFTMPAYAVTVDATFVGKHYDVTLDPDNGNSTSTIYPQYTAAMPSTLKGGGALTAPTYSGYDFQGYFDDHAGSGTKYYTNAMASANNWNKTSTASLYAKWTQTVELDANGGSSDGSVAVTYKGTAGTPSAPSYSGYTQDLGYFAESSCTTKVMNLNGSLVASVTDGSSVAWTNSSSKWIHAGSSELFAHWKCNAPSVSCTDNVVTITAPTGSTVRYTTDGSTDPTSSTGTVYDPSNKPVIAANTTIKAVAYRTGYTTSDVTTQAVTYTPVYTVGFTTTNTSKTSGETSVLQNKTYAATFTANTGYNLPTSVTVTIGGIEKAVTTDYTWSVSEGTGTLNILENKITGNVAITVSGVAQTYDGTLKNAAGTEIGTYAVTYGATSIVVDSEPTNTGYDIGGYYLNYNVESNPQYYNQVATSSKALMESVSTYTDSNGKWTATSAPDLIVKWDPHKYTVYLDQQGGAGGSTYFKVEMNSASYEFGDGKAATMTRPTRTGYDFAGYYTSAAPSGTQIFAASGSVISEVDNYTGLSSTWVCTSDFITLYAHWTPVALTSAGAGNWNSTDTWTPACVPTKEHDVTIAHAVSVSDAEVAKSVTINQSTGKLTIASTGTLDVIGTISNATEERLEVMAGGALIFDYSSAPAAKVHHSVSGGDFRYIALPISYVHVSNAFAGQGVYTYVWHEGSGWERRGYYDDILGNEPIAISGQSSWTFYGTLVNALFGSVAYTSGKTYAGMNMYANSWTAPIRISGVTISGTGAIQTVYTDNGGSWSPTTTGDPGDAVIPAMSAFVILSNEGGGSVSIPYNTAVRNVAVSPASAPKRVASDDLRKHITMNVIGNELKTNLRLYENEQFTNEFDNGWEAPFLEGDGRAGQLYTQTEDKMVIFATPDLEGTVVGFIPGEATDYTISFEGDGKGYYLNDLDEQESTLIEEGNTYVFTPNESSNATRFVISKMPIHKVTTGNDAINDGVKARKQMIDGILYIIRDGRMYDATGALVK